MAGKPVRNRVGPFSNRSALLKVDGRTAEAKLMAETDETLVEMYGGRERCSPARLYLIEATSLLRLRVAAMRTRAATGETLPPTFDKHLSALAGTLRTTLLALGLDEASAPELTLEQYIEMRLTG